MNAKNTLLPSLLLFAALGAALVAGCRREPPAAPEEAAPAPQDEAVATEEAEAPTAADRVYTLFSEASALYDGGSTNQALALLEEGLANPELAPERQQIFNMLVRMMTYAGRIDDVRDRLIGVYTNDLELATGSLGILYQHYAETQGDMKAAAEWTETVLALPGLPPPVRRAMREWNFVSYIQLDEADKVDEIAGALFRDAPAGDAVVILQRGLDMLFDRGRPEAVERILGAAGKVVTSDAATRNLIASSRLRLLAAKGAWKELADALPAATASLPDADLSRAIRRIFAAAATARQTAFIDDICRRVINDPAATNKAQSAAIVARQWVGDAIKAAPADVADRLELLVNRKFPPAVICNLFLRHFYDLIEDAAVVKEMKDVGERLIPMAPDDDTRSSLRTAVLDGCFLVEDYDGTLRILREGIAGHDKAWHDMAIAKVEAHKALAENRPLDAIKSFRSFMAIVGASQEGDAADPSTGIVHTKPMILGRNAKRIGDIYRDQLKDAAAAKAAYAEARQYYQTALEAKPDSDAIAVIRAEMAEIPE